MVSVPIAFGPRFSDPVRADEAIRQGDFDFWEVCRPMLADPLLVHKLAHDAVANGGDLMFAELSVTSPLE